MVSYYRGGIARRLQREKSLRKGDRMKMKKKRMILLLTCCISLVLLCACGGTSELSTSSADVTVARKELVKDADQKYPGCNSRNLYVEDEKGMGEVRQYTLDGNLVRTFTISDDLEILYVNDAEIIVQKWKEDEPAILYSIPIVQTEGGDILDVENMEEITKAGEEDCEEFAEEGNLYADKNYLVYISAYHELFVYDRNGKRFIKIKNDPKANHGFTNSCNSILDDSDGEYVVFNTEPVRGSGEDAECGFSLYHLGDDHITTIDEKCVTAAPYLFWDEKQAVLYTYEDEYNSKIEADDVWMYDCQTGKKEILISAEEIRDFLNQEGNQAKGYISEMYMDGTNLYLGITGSDEPLFLRYDLSGKGKLCMESRLNEYLKEIEDSIYLTAFAEGRCLIEQESGEYSCFTMDTGQYKKVTNNDEERFYFQCLGWWEEN